MDTFNKNNRRRKMSDKKNANVKDVVNEVLVDDAKINALNFLAFMDENDISNDSNGDGHGWAIGGFVGNSIGYLMVNGSDEFPGPWTFWFNTCDFKDSDIISDEIKEAAWSNVSPCGRCHDGWKHCGNGDRIIFDKKFESLCHSPLMFNNPDQNTLENVKKLLLIMKNQ